jgi:hypothetical protein
MGEFDDLDPAKLSQSVEAQRAHLQQERAEADRKAAEDATRQAGEEAAALAEAEQRTSQLLEFLRKTFHGQPMSINHKLVVEQTGSRPVGTGRAYVGEKPAWIVIRAGGSSMNPRHSPAIFGFAETVLAARCGVEAKYELIIYPITRQDQPLALSFGADDRDAFIKRIQDEIASR